MDGRADCQYNRSYDKDRSVGAAIHLRFDYYCSRISGTGGGISALIGITPPSILMAGRPHCLRRFVHARAVTERKYHYRAREIIASRSVTTCLRHRYCSLSLHRGNGVPAAWLPSSAHALNVSGISLFCFQAAIESFNLSSQ